MSAEPIGVAAWDFDGTITERDTLGGFLVFVGGRRRVARAVAVHASTLVNGMRSSEQRNAAKEAVLGSVLGGRHVDELTVAGAAYAQTLPQRFRRGSLERIAWHRSQQHRLVIVSASLVYYLRPVATDLGFDDVIAVEMATDERGVLTGALSGPNVRKAHKAERLHAWLDANLGEQRPEIWAYGDSSGDTELLAAADHPMWMGRRSGRS